MPTDTVQVAIALSNSDLADLISSLPSGSVTRQPMTRMDPYRAGDLGLATALILLVPPVIQTLAVWLAKQRTSESQEENLSIEKGADGSLYITVQKRSQGRTSTPPSPATVEALQVELTKLAEQLRTN